jgi:hypothetical protein
MERISTRQNLCGKILGSDRGKDIQARVIRTRIATLRLPVWRTRRGARAIRPRVTGWRLGESRGFGGHVA